MRNKAKKQIAPLFFSMLTLGYATSSHAAECTYEITSNWNVGYTVSVNITNNTSSTINGWKVSFQFAQSSISNLWNANVSGNNPYEVSHKNFNKSIGPNQSVSFGFNADKNNANGPAETPDLGGICDTGGGTVNLPPVASATVTPATAEVPFEATFNGAGSSDPENQSLTYRWEFNDGQTKNGKNVKRQFTQAGTYTAKLYVNDGEQDSAPSTVTVIAKDASVDPDPDPADPIAYNLQNSESSLYYVTTKKTHIVENNTFNSLSGSITTEGKATLSIDLESVDTNNSTRDGRMKSMLFETGTFKTANVELDVNMTALANQNVGSTKTETITATLDLHGVPVEITTQVNINKMTANKILIQNVTPILLDAKDFGLDAGVDALRDIANLSVVSYAVPVNFVLVYVKP